MHNLKRAGSNPAGPAPTAKKSRPLYETPFPNPSSDSLAYKLPSSVPKDTGKLSPVPVVRRTSSRNLKENRVGRKSKSRSKGVLESSFPIDADIIPIHFPKRTLSDKYPVNVQLLPLQSQPTTTSPQFQQLEFERGRRPSEPAPPRTHISFLDSDIKKPGNVEFSIPSSKVDFNRPPSQLSLYDGMFADVQFVSTPFRFARNLGEGTVGPRLLSKPLSDTDTDEEGEGDIMSPFKLLKRSLQKKRQMSAGYMSPDEEETEWITDSLISPPTRADVEMADPEPDIAELLSLDSLILGYGAHIWALISIFLMLL